jgi:hypothetical protein
MNKLKTFCITYLNNENQSQFLEYTKFLDTLDLEIIGADSINKKYPSHWLIDSTGSNISHKNKNYASLTVFFWIWKNALKNMNDNDWISLCHYRRFWIKFKHDDSINKNNLKMNILRSIPKEALEKDAIVNQPQSFENIKLSKMIKKGYKFIYKNPSAIFNKKKRTIKFHFDLFHIRNGLEKAATMLPESERNDFLDYINSETKIYPNNIFIMKKKFFIKLCKSTFSWMDKCEKIFNTKELSGYGETRIFDFIAERYYSFWITKYCNHITWPHKFIDIR